MRSIYVRSLFVLLAVIAIWAAPCVAQEQSSGGAIDAIDLNADLPLETLVQQLAAKRVVFIGEIHTRYDHHLNQLELIRRLHEINPAYAIGVEYFQQPFQAQVDEYIAGKISEHEFLRATEYFNRWGYDYRLYAPIFRYAREQKIPVRALNVPNALAAAVAKDGISGLSADQRAYLPHDIEPADEAYKNRLRRVFAEHQGMGPGNFNDFVEAQLVWDAGMAESAAAYLNADPQRRLVILAGAGHLEFGSGIPKRLERRTHASYSIVLSSGEDIEKGMADYLLLSTERDLPPAGVLGVELKDAGGQCRITSLIPGGAGAKAGLRKGDVLVSIDSQPIKTTADARLELWNKKPGDCVHVRVRRRHFFRTRERELDIDLAASHGVGGR